MGTRRNLRMIEIKSCNYTLFLLFSIEETRHQKGGKLNSNSKQENLTNTNGKIKSICNIIFACNSTPFNYRIKVVVDSGEVEV